MRPMGVRPLPPNGCEAVGAVARGRGYGGGARGQRGTTRRTGGLARPPEVTRPRRVCAAAPRAPAAGAAGREADSAGLAPLETRRGTRATMENTREAEHQRGGTCHMYRSRASRGGNAQCPPPVHVGRRGSSPIRRRPQQPDPPVTRAHRRPRSCGDGDTTALRSGSG